MSIHIREHYACSTFQVRPDAFRNSGQLVRSAFFRLPRLSLFDPGVELKIWVFRFHGFDVLWAGSHLPLRRVLSDRSLATDGEMLACHFAEPHTSAAAVGCSEQKAGAGIEPGESRPQILYLRGLPVLSDFL